MVKKMIKRKVVYLSLILFLSLTLIFPGNWVQAASGIPDNLGYQGRLKDNSGLALDGNFDFIFKLYDTASGGTPLWTETKSDVKVEAGYFSVNLGESVPFSGSVDFTRPLWLEVYVAPHGQTPEKTEPRIAINSVAFALSARAIENLPSEPTTNLYGGRMYYNTTTGKIYVYDDVAGRWVNLGDFQSLSLDEAYNNFGVNPAKVKIDSAEGQGSLEFELSGDNDLKVNLVGNGDFVVERNGVPFATFNKDKAFHLTGNSYVDGTQQVNGDLVVNSQASLGNLTVMGNSTFLGQLTGFMGGPLTINAGINQTGGAGVNFSGLVKAENGLDVSGDSTIINSDPSKPVKIDDDLYTTGNSYVDGTQQVNGDLVVNSQASLGNLMVMGNSTFLGQLTGFMGGPLTINAGINQTGGAGVNFSGLVKAENGLDVSGDSTIINSDPSKPVKIDDDLYTTGNSYVDGMQQVGGNLNVVGQGQVGSLMVMGDSTFAGLLHDFMGAGITVDSDFIVNKNSLIKGTTILQDTLVGQDIQAHGVLAVDKGMTVGDNAFFHGYLRAADKGLATKVSPGPCTDPYAPEGSLCVDSTNGRIYFRYGGNWHYVAQTAGFQIPDFETKDLLTNEELQPGDYLLGYVESKLSDNALHGRYVKFDKQGLEKRISNLEEKVNRLVVGAPVNEKVEITPQIVSYRDLAGQAKILPGDREVRVSFEEEYATPPIVTLTPINNQDGVRYWLDEVNNSGFVIKIESPQPNSLLFNWMASPSQGSKLFVSDGTRGEIEIIVSNSPEENQPIIEEDDNNQAVSSEENNELTKDEENADNLLDNSSNNSDNENKEVEVPLIDNPNKEDNQLSNPPVEDNDENDLDNPSSTEEDSSAEEEVEVNSEE